MRIVVAGVAFAVLAVSAAAAPKDPKTLVLRPSDFPAGTRADVGSTLKGPDASEVTSYFMLRPGDLEREEEVSISVWIAKDEASAKRIHNSNVWGYSGKGPSIGPPTDAFKDEVALTLPKWGDEQYADYLPDPKAPHGQLFVRKGNVVWYLTVENCTPNAPVCYGTSRSEAPIGQATALAELKKYGARQAARVGKG